MKLLKFDITLENATLSGYIDKATLFRKGIKQIAPHAQVSLTFSSTGQLIGDVQIQKLPLSQLSTTVSSISTYIQKSFPQATIIFLYQDSEDD